MGPHCRPPQEPAALSSRPRDAQEPREHGAPRAPPFGAGRAAWTTCRSSIRSAAFLGFVFGFLKAAPAVAHASGDPEGSLVV